MATATSSAVILEGRSSAKYEFHVYPWGTDFKPLGAVYTVLKLRPDRRYDVIYVGETGDLSERFDNHHKAWCFDRDRRSHIGVRQDPSERSRLTIEADLVANHQPPCNG